MPRWEPDAVGRLQAAAFDLFAEQGYDGTTVDEIAARAGLSRRTFFNHFTDKREVLVGREAEALQRELVFREIAQAPADVRPLDAVVLGLEAAGDEIFEGRRSSVVRREQIIAANPELQERELHKRLMLTDTIASALIARGTSPYDAELAARAGMLLQQTALQQWVHEGTRPAFRELLRHALLALRAMLEESPAPTPSR